MHRWSNKDALGRLSKSPVADLDRHNDGIAISDIHEVMQIVKKTRKCILMLAYQAAARYWEPSVPSIEKKELEVHVLMVSHA